LNSSRQAAPRDAELSGVIIAAKSGNADAFATLYDEYVGRVYRYVRIRTASDSDSEDLTEQVFLKAWQALPRFEERGRPFIAWLYAIAGNIVADHFRSRAIRAGQHAELDPNMVDGHPETDPVEVSERDQRRRQLETAIRRLPPAQQKVVVMRFIEGMSSSDIAEATGQKEGTIRVIQHRALSALKGILGREKGAL
jgi:RNA polymerase sigma-70 factor (ECF subfamily)